MMGASQAEDAVSPENDEDISESFAQNKQGEESHPVHYLSSHRETKNATMRAQTFSLRVPQIGVVRSGPAEDS